LSWSGGFGVSVIPTSSFKKTLIMPGWGGPTKKFPHGPLSSLGRS
jgi:hypothetical protein